MYEAGFLSQKLDPGLVFVFAAGVLFLFFVSRRIFRNFISQQALRNLGQLSGGVDGMAYRWDMIERLVRDRIPRHYAALSSANVSDLKGMCSPEFMAELDEQLTRWREAGVRYVAEVGDVKSAVPIKYYKGHGGREVLMVLLRYDLVAYLADAGNGELMEGTSKQKDIQIIWELVLTGNREWVINSSFPGAELEKVVFSKRY